MVFDVTQRISMNGLRHDGCVPTLTTGSAIYTPALNIILGVEHLSVLMGFTFKAHVWHVMRRTSWRACLGNTMHVPVVGMVVLFAVKSLACLQEPFALA